MSQNSPFPEAAPPQTMPGTPAMPGVPGVDPQGWIYGYSPAAYAGHYPGHTQSYASPEEYEDADLSGFDDLFDDEDFSRNFEFGVIDNGLLLAMALAGLSLEDYIKSKTGVSGYGVVLGASLGNAISGGVAALPQGMKAAGGVTLGALVPVIPVGIALALKKPPEGFTKNLLLGTSAGLLIGTFFVSRMRRRKK